MREIFIGFLIGALYGYLYAMNKGQVIEIGLPNIEMGGDYGDLPDIGDLSFLN